DAFESYGDDASLWVGAQRSVTREGQIIIVQAVAGGRIESFLTRDPATGALGPAAPNGAMPGLPAPEAARLAEFIDAKAGKTMSCLVSVEGGTVRFLSARSAQSSPAAELEAAVDRVGRKVWSPAEAVTRTDPARLQTLLHPRLKTPENAELVASGLGVSPGAASGVIVFTAEDAARMRARGHHCILVVPETGPADIQGMKA